VTAIRHEPLATLFADVGILTTMANASVELAKLHEQRSRAATRVDELKREARTAALAAADASAALADHDRHGGTPAAKRRELDQTLAAAKARAAEPWAEGVAGAVPALRCVTPTLRCARSSPST
jgi:chromosome segregation ATPase